MKKKQISNIIFPNKKINYFTATIIILGIISGSVFLISLNPTDKTAVIDQIKTFISNINNNKINSGLALKNSLLINYIFIGLIFCLGLSMIGIIVNVFLTYIRGFIIGFSLSSMILTYSYKGIVIAALYAFPVQLLNLFSVWAITTYSIMFSKNLLAMIMNQKKNSTNNLKKYFVILIICIITSFLASVIESYLFPNILKTVIGIYI